jgi:hypothetical protein
MMKKIIIINNNIILYIILKNNNIITPQLRVSIEVNKGHQFHSMFDICIDI